jgi:hypothetical protein
MSQLTREASSEARQCGDASIMSSSTMQSATSASVTTGKLAERGIIFSRPRVGYQPRSNVRQPHRFVIVNHIILMDRATPPCHMRCSRVRGFAGSRVRGFAGSRVRGFAGSRVRGFAGSRVRGFAGSRLPPRAQHGFATSSPASPADGRCRLESYACQVQIGLMRRHQHPTFLL